MKLSKLLSHGTLVLLMVGSFSSAQGSWFQEDCSNGEGTIKISRGHDANGVTILRTGAGEGPRKFVYDRDQVRVEFSDQRVLDSNREEHCAPGTHHGYINWSKKTASKAFLTLVDGGLFPQGVPGLSEDQRTIQAHVICDFRGNSRGTCRQ